MSVKKSNIADPNLLKLRYKIDEIDNQIIDLLAARMDVVDEVAILKRSKNENIFIRSNREADMIKDIVVKLDGRYPKSHIMTIWRKIIAAANLHEQEINIGLYNPDNIPDYKYLINEYYSRDFAVQSFDNARKLISDIESGDIKLGILPVPNSSQEPWWQLIVDSNINIFAKIPFIENESDHELFCVAIKEVEPSQSDKTLLYLETKNNIEKNQIEEILQELNFEISSLSSQNSAQDMAIFLYEIKGYIAYDNIDLRNLQDKDMRAKILGYFATQI